MTEAAHPWAALVRERGGLALRSFADADGASLSRARFAALLVEDEGLLPAIARLVPGQISEHPGLAELDVYLLKSGVVAGPAGERGARTVEERFVAAVLDAALAGEVEWEEDPDFGYLVAAAAPGLKPGDRDLLMPRFLYARNERVYEHAALVPELKRRGPPWGG